MSYLSPSQSASVPLKGGILFWLIECSLLLLMFVGGRGCVLFVIFQYSNHLNEEERELVVLLYLCSYCHVSFNVAVAWVGL